MSPRIRTACLLVTALSLASWGCGGSGAATSRINNRAALTGSLPWNPLQWSVIASSIDRPASTMSTLYGNGAAVQYARSNPQQDYPPDYPPGSVLALVTWTQQEDTRWFGARIPGPVKSVEFVNVTSGSNGQPSYSYEKYQGSPLQRTTALDGRSPGSRAASLLSVRAAVMP